MRKLRDFFNDLRNNGEAEIFIDLRHVFAITAIIVLMIYTCNQ